MPETGETTANQQPQANPAVRPPSRFKRAMRVVRRTLLVLFLLVLALLSSLQTGPMREFLKNKLVSIVESNTNGTVSIGEIGGNLITGLSLSNVTVRLKSDTAAIARIHFLSVRYSIIDYFVSNSITIHSLLVDAPEIRFHRSFGDSLWNYERFFKPSAPSTKPSQPFSQTVRLEALSVAGGSFRVLDANDTSLVRLLPDGKKRYIRWSDLDVRDIALTLSGRYQGSVKQYVNLEHLSCREANAPFNLYQLSLSAYHDGNITEVKNVRLLTDHTELKLDASLSPLVMLNGQPYDSLRTSATHVKLTAGSIGQDELAQFIPDISFLAGRPSLDFEAEGPYGALKIRRGRLGLGRGSFITFGGEVKNLHQPDKLYLDVDVAARSLSDKSIRDYIPGLGLPDMKRFGTIDIDHIGFVGRPDNFKTELAVRTTHGNVNGTAALNLSIPSPTYETQLTTTSLDLAPLLGDSVLRSSLNMTFAAKGNGFDLKTMSTTFSVESATPSSFYGLDLTSTHLVGAIDHDAINLDQSNIHFADGSHIDANYLTLDLAPATPTYECDLSTTDIPIGRLVPVFPHASTLSASATIAGDLKSVNSTTGSIQAVITGMPYRGSTLAPISVNTTMQIDSVTGERSDVIASDIADLTVRGKYDIVSIGGVLAERFAAFAGSIQHMRDTSKHNGSISPHPDSSFARNSDSIACTYTLHMKDMRPLTHFLPNLTLLAKGRLDGAVAGDPHALMNVSMAGTLDHFLIADAGSGAGAGVPKISVKKLGVQVALRGLAHNDVDVLNTLQGSLSLQSDSALRVADVAVFAPHVTLKLSGEAMQYVIGGSLEGKTALDVRGAGSIAGAEKTFGIDSLRLTFSDGFDWFNDAPSRVHIDEHGTLTLDTLRLFKPEPSYDPGHVFAQKLQLGMQLRGDTIAYGFVHSSLLRLPELPRFLSSWVDVSSLRPTQGKLTRLLFDVSGTLAQPRMALDLAAQNFAYNNVTLDSMRANLSYGLGNVRGNIDAHIDSSAYGIGSMARGLERWIPSAKNTLSVAIDSIPMLLSFADYPEKRTDSARIASAPTSVSVTARDFAIDMFGPFIPVLTQIHGLADATISLHGSLTSPTIQGEGYITKGSFLVPFTNIRYQMGGRVTLAHLDLNFDDVRVSNYPVDLEGGRAFLSGGFHFHGFDVENFDLKLRTDDRLLVLNDASKDAMKTIYGPLIVRSGNTPLHFYGTFDAPHLDGDLTIAQAYLTLPQSSNTIAQVESEGITYIEATKPKPPADTANIQPSPQPESAEDAEAREFELRSAPSVAADATGIEANKSTTQQSAPQLSFMDKMLYDMNIMIPGDCWLIITFPQAYGIFGTQLKAELKSDGPFHFYRYEPKADYGSTGTLRLTERSSYTFIKEFTPVKGTMQFYKALDNPTLDLSAEYTGSYGPGDIRIRMLVGGTRYDPSLRFELWQKNQQGEYVKRTEPQEQQRNESFFFLATGMLPNDANAASAVSTLGSIKDKSGYSIGSSFVSSALNNAIASTSLKDYIRSARIEFGANNAVKVNATLNVYRDIVLRGGVSNAGFGNASDFSLEIPFSTFLTFQEAQNIVFQAEGHINSSIQSLVAPPAYVGRFGWRIPLN
ncbi:MAG: translocation/assembly module TamB domain-containing protein [Bacteroidetes bacterium]|nr:translocation/assembly module TamB domain-containing protein [Bacteroidota bacterium]